MILCLFERFCVDFGSFFGSGSVVLRGRAVWGLKPPLEGGFGVVCVAICVCARLCRFGWGSVAYSFLWVGSCFLSGGCFVFFVVILAFSFRAPMRRFGGAFFGFWAILAIFIFGLMSKFLKLKNKSKFLSKNGPQTIF